MKKFIAAIVTAGITFGSTFCMHNIDSKPSRDNKMITADLPMNSAVIKTKSKKSDRNAIIERIARIEALERIPSSKICFKEKEELRGLKKKEYSRNYRSNRYRTDEIFRKKCNEYDKNRVKNNEKSNISHSESLEDRLLDF